jgi:putative oxidoreductase
MDAVNTALLILRVWAGVVFLAHGVKHARGREKTGNWLASVGFRNADFQWLAMTVSEIGVGALLIAGLLTPLAAAGLIGTMVVAYVVVHRKVGFWVTARPDEGWEYVATLVAMAFAIAILGPGEWSLDDALGIADDLDGWVGGLLAAGGVLSGLGQLALFWKPVGDKASS